MNKNGLYHKVLPNGLTILIQEKETCSTAIAVGVRFGSAYHSLAHFIGHMLFKGTKSRTRQDISREAIKGGGSMDDITDLYSTVYFIKTISGLSYQALDLLCDMIANSAFSAKELEYEKLVIQEEIIGRSEEPTVILKGLLYKNLYNNDKFSTATNQEQESLNDLSREQIFNVYRQFYVPERLIFAVVGKADKEKVLKIIERHFRRLKGGVLVPFNQRSGKPITEAKRIVVKKGGLKHAHLMLGFKMPSIYHPDYYPLVVLQTIIAGNIASRLYEQLREKRGLLYNIVAKLDYPAEQYGTLRLYTNFDPNNLYTVETIIQNEFKKLGKKGVSEEELKIAKFKLIHEHQLKLEGTFQHARLLIEAELNNQLKKIQRFSACIRRVKTKDIRRVIRQHCNLSKSVTVILKPYTKK